MGTLTKTFALLRKSVLILAQACDANPLLTTGTVILFYIYFNFLEAMIEALIFGERFLHWLDPIFACIFIVYSAYAVYGCALYNGGHRATQ